LQANSEVPTDVFETESLQELARLARVDPGRVSASKSDCVASTGALISQLLLKAGSFESISSGNFITWPQFSARSVTQFSSSDSHALVCCSDGSLWSWGSNSCGQLGKPQTVSRIDEPQLVLESHGIVCVSAGSQHSIAVSVHGSLFLSAFENILSALTGFAFSFGCNSRNQLGYKSTSSLINCTPRVIRLPVDSVVKQASAGDQHSLLLLEDGTLFGSGDTTTNQLGLTKPSRIMSKVEFHAERPAPKFKYVSASSNWSLGISVTGQVLLIESHNIETMFALAFPLGLRSI
jgi:alpha-tubulin suppressor-like RCC1 family protein